MFKPRHILTTSLFSLLLMTAFTQPVSAGVLDWPKINQILAFEDDVWMVMFDKAIVNPTPCGVPNPNRFAVQASTPGGKAMIASLLMAFQAGKPIRWVQGRGEYPQQYPGTAACHAWGDTESIKYVVIE